jgi:hypothetical protein|mmetsp:Transcript_66841/g.111858  ORF Transcript_66841/g.111858 Transcript_66841/m.111858 type:complete len:98 (+) Transcript_66841:113-406(+)
MDEDVVVSDCDSSNSSSDDMWRSPTDDGQGEGSDSEDSDSDSSDSKRERKRHKEWTPDRVPREGDELTQTSLRNWKTQGSIQNWSGSAAVQQNIHEL